MRKAFVVAFALAAVLSVSALAASTTNVDLLKTFSPIQEKVVRLYFGLGCQRSHSAAEMAQEFHVSPQVIAGILSGAERKLGKAGWTPSALRQAGRRDVVAMSRRR